MAPRRPILDPQQLAALRSVGVQRSFEVGERLIVLGAESSAVFYLNTGRAKVLVLSSQGQQSVLGLRNAGEFVGETSALIDVRVSIEVVAVQPTSAVMVTAARFGDYLGQNPNVTMALLRLQNQRMSDMVERSIIAGRPVVSRVAHRLLELAGSGSIAQGATVRLTQADLAQHVDASREWTAKALGALRRDGLISTRRSTVTILDPDGLRQRSLRS